MSDLWPAPTAAGPVRARVRVPGSKSATNRALILAALADSPSRLIRPLRARDTDLMAEALRTLGTTILDDGSDLVVTPGEFRGPATIDCGLAGTVMRFVPAIAPLARGDVHFDGDPRARQRPMRPMLDALRSLGAKIDDGGRGGLPFTVHGTGGLPGGVARLDASTSSQFVSALLLAGCRFDHGLTVRHEGSSLPSLPHIDMTLAMLNAWGCWTVVIDESTWHVDAGSPAGRSQIIEPDLSNAAPFLAAAVITGGSVTVSDWPHQTSQPGDLLRELLAAMGADVSLTAGECTVRGTGRIRGINLDLGGAGELTPVLVALAALADGPSRIGGIGHLRGHETDRLAALSKEITGLGGDVRELGDGLEVRPRPMHGGVFNTYDDHRLAQAAAVLGLAVPGVLVENVATTGKTMPDFVDRWIRMLGGEASG